MEPNGEPITQYWAEVAPGYWLSNLGNLYSFKTHKILTPKRLDKHGHVGYCLQMPWLDKPKYEYLHRLMAEAFIPNPNNYPLVRHLNDDPKDNVLDNLAWGTQKDNWKDSYDNGHAHFVTEAEREKWLEKCRRPVYAVDLTTWPREPILFQSIKEAAAFTGTQAGNISKVLSGDRGHTEGWAFFYEEDYVRPIEEE